MFSLRQALSEYHEIEVHSTSRLRVGSRIKILSAFAILFLVAATLVASSLFKSSAASSPSSANPAEFNSLFNPVTAGTINIKSGNYIGNTTTQTATITKEIFASSDCTGTGGTIDTVTGVDSITGHSFPLGAGTSVKVSIPDSGPGPVFFSHLSEQNGFFVGFQVADNSYQSSIIYLPGDGHQVCIVGFDGTETRTYKAQFYAGIQLFDSCGNERESFRPGETMTIKVSGGVTFQPNPHRLLAAGGSVNECTFLPIAPDFTPVNVTSDPFYYDFTLPDSNDDILPSCASGNTTSILGDWRVVAFDPSCGCNRAQTRFTLAEDAIQPGCGAGTLTIKSGNYLGASTTQTATFTKQVFASNNCSGPGGSIDTVSGVNSTTGHSFTLGAGSSVQVTIPDSGPGPVFFSHLSDQNGFFVGWQAAESIYSNSIIYAGDGHQVCIQGFDGVQPRTYKAQFYAGVELFDACGNERYDFRPGETVTIKVSGGLTQSALPLKLFAAGGSVNECTFLPSGPGLISITSDPFIYEFTLPDSNADIPSACASGNTTSILGNWRIGVLDQGCGCLRNQTNFTVSADAPLGGCPDGTVTIKSGNYLGASTTQTAKFTKQVFNTSDCTGTGGSVDLVTGVDSTTGHTMTLGVGKSVQITIPDSDPGFGTSYRSEQNGLFVGLGAADNSYSNSVIYSGDGHQVCVQGFQSSQTRTYNAYYYPGIQLYDACGNERDSFRPGETMTFKVSGGLTLSALPLKLLAAGGSVNECTYLPMGGDPLVSITSDPFTYEFTLPDSNADIPSYCLSSNSTSILGNWRVVTFDQSCGCNRGETRWTVATDAFQPGCTMTCPGPITVPNDNNSCGAVVNYTPPTVGSSTVTCDHPPGSTFPVGTTLVTCSSNAGPTCSFNVTVNDTQNPSITAPAGFTVNADSGSCFATGVSLGTPTTGDNCLVSSVSNNAPAQFPIGQTTVTWTVNDNHGHSATATQVVTVVDGTAPVFTLKPTINLAPTTHEYHLISVSDLATASDNCGVNVTGIYITKVTSDEPENGANDGNTLNDIVIAANCTSVRLREERNGSGNGRVYRVFLKVVDSAGNVATVTAKVTVNVSKTTAIEDAPQYTVTSGCP